MIITITEDDAKEIIKKYITDNLVVRDDFEVTISKVNYHDYYEVFVDRKSLDKVQVDSEDAQPKDDVIDLSELPF